MKNELTTPPIKCAHDELVALQEIQPNPRNPNTHPPDQIKALAKIISHQGWRSPLVVSNQSGFVVAGHGRYEAALILGVESVPVNFQDFENEADEWAHLIADNRLAELADMNESALADLLIELDTGAIDLTLTGFDENALASLVNKFGDDDLIDAEPQIDQAKELSDKWGTKLGQVWQLGDHLIACGDSTNADDVARLMDGEKAGMMVTDPPYGVEYDGGRANSMKREKLIGDDSTEVFGKALPLAAKHMPSGAWYIWHADRYAEPVYAAIRENGFDVRALIIWNKLKAHYGAPSAHYCQKHEPCLYAVKGNANFVGVSNEVTVWDIEQPFRNEFHPTQKPLECMARAIRNHDAATVFDPFLGSGSTLMACENLGRKCRGIELSPEYIAVTLQRWHEATGKHPDLIK